MARLKVYSNGFQPIYGLSGIAFAFVSTPDPERRQLTEFYTCRDYLNDRMREHYHIDDYHDDMLTAAESIRRIDTNNLRLLITKELKTKRARDEFRERLYAAKRIINIYEEIAGFEDKSVIARVDYDKTQRVKCCWQLFGPKEWMTYSQLLSMVTLILRTVTNVGGAGDIETIKDLNNYWKWVCKNGKEIYNHSDVRTYIPNCWKKFHMMMGTFDRIFTLPPNEAFPAPENHHNWHGCGGINALCTFSTNVGAIDSAMKRAWRSWKRRKWSAWRIAWNTTNILL